MTELGQPRTCSHPINAQMRICIGTTGISAEAFYPSTKSINQLK